MWKLEKHTTQQENDYFDLVFKTIRDEITRIQKNSTKTHQKGTKKKGKRTIAINNTIEKWFLDKDKVKRLILAEPNKMAIFDRYYRFAKYKFPKIPWDADINRVLNYVDFTKKDHSSGLAAKLAEIKSVRSCPYCNRAYTMLVPQQKTYIIRADFDHFLTKSKYPLFALSLYNLIPSCLNCNRTIKKDKELDIHKHLHPYLNNSDRDKWEFSYRMNGVDKYSLEIDTSKCSDSRIDETLQLLRLEEIYQKAHSDYELKDMIELNKSYGKIYIHDLISKVMKDSGLSERDVYLHLFGIEFDSNNDLNRILNKMRRDIINKLKIMIF